MESISTAILTELSTSLASLIAKGTVSAVQSKIKVWKDEKDSSKLKNNYEELINEIIEERSEAVRLAQAYKNELEKVIISDKDIEHLHATMTRLIELIAALGKTDLASKEALEAIKALISIDTLKSMQLLGFNYKAAIGEPLTELCAQKIAALGESKAPMSQHGKKR